MSDYIQVGVTALRDPGTGELLPAVPLYIRAEDARVKTEAEAVAPMADEIAPAFAQMIKDYINGCRAAGVPM